MKTQPQPTQVPIAKLRRIALERQGLLKNAPFGRGVNATLRALEQLGYVQIDTISVVARAHDHVLGTRVPNYAPVHLDKLQRRGEVFEYWSHAAAYLPMRDFRFALPRMRKYASGEERWVRSRDRKLINEVHARVRSEGPSRARDFDYPSGVSGGWWNWKPAKRALEQLFMQGDLMVVGRDGFQKIYDLTERVLPAGVDTSEPNDTESARHLLHGALRSHGFTTQKSVTYQRRSAGLRKALKLVIEEALGERQLQAVTLPGGETAYIDPELLDQRAAPVPSRVSILSPFDNAVIQRDRSIAVFDFDYQIECYVTESKRRYGYFCLPLLYRDRFVGRADCKAHRRTGRFEIRSLYIEDEQLSPARNPEFSEALLRAFTRFATFNGCTEIIPGSCHPEHWAAIF